MPEQEGDAAKSSVRGEAAWNAERNATEQRNAAAKRRAHDHLTAAAHATAQRERRMAQVESEQLVALNAALAARDNRRP